jgi:spermidine synthase
MPAVFEKPSPYGMVSVRDGTLYIDNWEQCSTKYASDASERNMADYAIHATGGGNQELRVLNIGLGCGLTAKRALTYPRVSLDVAEINPVVVEANRLLSDVQGKERFTLIVEDGLQYLRANDHPYDSILIDIEDPRIVHSSNLYTVEAFKLVAERLQDGGVLAFWTFAKPDGDPTLVARYKDILYYSLREAFPYVYDYPGVFLAAKQRLTGATEYEPTGARELNTSDKKILAEIFPDMLWSHR